MSGTATTIKTVLGFITAVENPQFGIFGGYLLLNQLGRPLEFHCTTPVKPNRTQEILYGVTLQDFLYGEQIGLALLAQAKQRPVVILTDCGPMLAVRNHTTVPVAWVFSDGEPSSRANANGECQAEHSGEAAIAVGETDRAGQQTSPTGQQKSSSGAEERPILRRHPAHGAPSRWHVVELGRNRLALPHVSPEEHGRLTDALVGVAETLDLCEPFQRIREAIEEAQRLGVNGGS
jgi:hypothetical protein